MNTVTTIETTSKVDGLDRLRLAAQNGTEQSFFNALIHVSKSMGIYRAGDRLWSHRTLMKLDADYPGWRGEFSGRGSGRKNREVA